MSPEFKLTEVQQQAAFETLNRNIALSAGAGCGKTFVLASRFTNLLASSKKEDAVDRIVALTFTEKAALEMSQRVSIMLKKLIDVSPGPQEAERLKNWAENSDQFRISTIHSFCSSILRTYAIDIGLDPEFQVCADEFYIDALLHEAIEKTLIENLDSESDLLAELLTNIDYDSLVKIVHELIHCRDRIDFLDYLNPAAVLNRWKELSASAVLEVVKSIKTDADLLGCTKELSALLDQYSANDDKAYIHCENLFEIILHILNAEEPNFPWVFEQLKDIKFNCGSKKNWNSLEDFALAKKLGKTIKDILKNKYSFLANSINSADLSCAQSLSIICDLANKCNDKFTQLKQEDSILDFTDLIVYTSKMLQENPALTQKISDGIDQLLIDEGQDTDKKQIELLKSIVANEQGDLESGKVFIVGDSKQSIYRFRGAELKSFDELCGQIGRGNQLNLHDTFRTHTAGVEFINHLFNKLMPSYFTRTQSLRLLENANDSVEIILADGSDDSESKTAEFWSSSQAAVTAQRVEQLITSDEKTVWDANENSFRRAEPKDIAILFSRMTESLAYEKELQRRNIPYYVVAGTGFFKQQEVYDVLNFLRAIENSTDDISFVGVLRSPMVGINDDSLYHIAQHVAKPYLPNLLDDSNLYNLAKVLTADQLAKFSSAANFITQKNRVKNSILVPNLIEQILEFTAYDSFLLSRDQGKRMLGNIRQLISFATTSVGELSLAEFLNNMNDLTVKQTRYEQAAAVAEHENVVRLMTIHKSKGLEFPIVIVPDLNQKMRNITSQVLFRNDLGLATKLAFNDDENEAPSFWDYETFFEKRDEHAEMIRKYYVALTRHEDRLILVGANKRDKNGQFPAASFIGQLDKHLNLSKAVDSTIKYGANNQYRASVKFCKPEFAKQTESRSKSIGRQILANANSSADVENSLRALAVSDEMPPLAEPIKFTNSRFKVAPTVLAAYKQCPMAYYWKYELRAPIKLPNLTDLDTAKNVVSEQYINPLELGTLLHKCFELYNFASPQTARQLLTLASDEIDFLTANNFSLIEKILSRVLDKFTQAELANNLADTNEIYREIDFTTTQSWGDLTGQIDLLYKLGENWHVVDYKSDRVANDYSSKLEHYKTQLAVYANAVQKITGQLPASTSLYFLRTGKLESAIFSQAEIADLLSSLEQDALKLRQSQSSQIYERCNLATCEFCSNQAFANISTIKQTNR